MRAEKREVRAFYDQYGWEPATGELYKDQELAVDTRPLLGEYFERAHRRVAAALPRTGRRFLDAGSGPLPHPEQVALSDGFDLRVCADISIVALRGARAKLPAAGYVVADLCSLPFRSGAFDAAVCAHVLYHVPGDEQHVVVAEVRRALAPGGAGVLIGARSGPLIDAAIDPRAAIARIPVVGPVLRRLRAALRGGEPRSAGTSDAPPPLYVHVQPWRWWARIAGVPGTSVRAWATLDVALSRRRPDSAAGRWLLRRIAGFEDRCPRLAARVGRYPMAVVSP